MLLIFLNSLCVPPLFPPSHLMVGGCIQRIVVLCSTLQLSASVCAQSVWRPLQVIRGKYRQSLLLLVGKVIFFTSQLFCFCRIPDCQSFSIVLHWVTKVQCIALGFVRLHLVRVPNLYFGSTIQLGNLTSSTLAKLWRV